MTKTITALETVSEKKRREIETVARNSGTMVLKALLNRLDAKTFPLKKETDPVAADVAVMVRHLSPEAFKIIRPRLEKLRANPSKINAVLQTPVRLLPKISVSETNLPQNGNTVPRSAHSKVELLIRALHCVDETDPEGGADEMILGGVLIGASGNLKVVNSKLCGSFDSGERLEYPPYAQHFGLFSLNTTATFPKFFFAIFKLIESDANDDDDAASGLTELLNLLCLIARNSVAKPSSPVAYPIYASSLALMLVYLIEVNFDEEDFSPFLVNIKITESDAAESGNLRTNDIRGEGGNYRIGYKWRLLT